MSSPWIRTSAKRRWKLPAEEQLSFLVVEVFESVPVWKVRILTGATEKIRAVLKPVLDRHYTSEMGARRAVANALAPLKLQEL